MAATSLPSPRAAANPALIRIAIAVALPLVAAGTILGTFEGYEVIVAAGWIALSLAGVLFMRPVVGIAAMTVLFLLAAYPTPLQALGFLTINNLLGVCFVVLSVAEPAHLRPARAHHHDAPVPVCGERGAGGSRHRPAGQVSVGSACRLMHRAPVADPAARAP